jgi:hypothetical protein
MQAREQPIFSVKAGQTRAFHFHQLFAPTTYPIQISGCRNTLQQSVLHLVLEIARLYQGSWSAAFYKKSDRHPDQSNLVAKISRGYVDSLPKPCLTWTEAIFAKSLLLRRCQMAAHAFHLYPVIRAAYCSSPPKRRSTT